MKKFLTLATTLCFVLGMNAQVNTPRPSPKSKLEQRVGLTDVTIEYSRPGVKERQIFGSLVPFNEYWRTGANQGTKISFSEDVMFHETEVEKGTYTLFTKPGKDSWEVVLYDDLSINVPPKELEEEKIEAKVIVRPIKTERKYETLTFDINDIKDDYALIYLMWENTSIVIPLKVHTDDQVIATIEDAMDGPNANEYRNAANYYSKTGRDLNKALEWINKSLDMNPDRYWVLRDKSHIQAKLGDFGGAIETAKKSKMLAEENGNMQYVKFNDESIAEWTSKLQMKK